MLEGNADRDRERDDESIDPFDEEIDLGPVPWTLRHPERRRMLRILHRSDGPRSAQQLGDERGLSLALACYHAGSLREDGMLAVEGREPGRGKITTYFRSQAPKNLAAMRFLTETEEEDEAEDRAT